MSVNVGILGFAHSHVNAYCNRWRQDAPMSVRVVAGWDHNATRLDAAREDHGVEPAESPDDLLGRDDVDAVVVAAETSLHAELVERAAAAGKAIVLQKPMALTMEQADRIVAAVRASGVPLTMAWQMRVDPQNVKMKQLLAGGQFGRLLMVRRRHGLSTHVWPNFEQSWHVDPDYNRDIWADDASHPIDFIYWLLGTPASVTAELGSLLNPKVPNDHGIAIFRYGEGVFAEVSCSFTCVAAEGTTEILCEKGTIVQSYGDGPSTNVPRPDGAVGLKWFLHETGQWTESGIPTPAGHGERIAALAGPLAEFLQGRREAIATAEEGREALRMVLACYESAEAGRRVTL